ncbi:MAG: glycosyltransferase [Sphingomonadales bacterium]|nr:glycosyltransferase [Sphingomonadales bacterium]
MSSKPEKYHIYVVTVCKNDKKRLIKTIKSMHPAIAMNDALTHIIVDGESVDDTMEILGRYKTTNPTRVVYISEQDTGIYDAMNKGIDMIKEQGYILFLNAGDELYDMHVISDIQQAVVRSSYPDLLACCFGYTRKDLYWDICGFMDLRHKINTGALICQQSLVYSRTCFPAGDLFNASYRIAGTMIIFSRLLKGDYTVSQFPRAIVRYEDSGLSEMAAEEGRAEIAQIRKLVR